MFVSEGDYESDVSLDAPDISFWQTMVWLILMTNYDSLHSVDIWATRMRRDAWHDCKRKLYVKRQREY